MPYHIPKQAGTIRKYRAIKARFNELYNTHRIRYDDVIEKLMDEFFIMDSKTISRILSTDLPDTIPPRDPNQMEMFTPQQD